MLSQNESTGPAGFIKGPDSIRAAEFPGVGLTIGHLTKVTQKATIDHRTTPSPVLILGYSHNDKLECIRINLPGQIYMTLYRLH
jgi:hypothetical protein